LLRRSIDIARIYYVILGLDISIGGNDDIVLGEGGNMGIEVAFEDTITSGSGRDIVSGDSVVIDFSPTDALATK
jgi:hypothetical protein